MYCLQMYKRAKVDQQKDSARGMIQKREMCVLKTNYLTHRLKCYITFTQKHHPQRVTNIFYQNIYIDNEY